MASVFKRGRDHGKKSSVWYVSYTDEAGKRRTLKGFRDKGLTEQLGSKMDTEVMLRKREQRPDIDPLTGLDDLDS